MTALALAADDCTAFSVSKDGSIVQLDVDTCKRCRPAFATLSVIVNNWEGFERQPCAHNAWHMCDSVLLLHSAMVSAMHLKHPPD